MTTVTLTLEQRRQRGRRTADPRPAVRTPDRPPVPGTRRPPAPLPLTAAQAGMWTDRPDPASPALGTAGYLEIHGPLHTTLFAEALHRTVTEAEALRVRIVDTPQGVRQLLPNPGRSVNPLAQGVPSARRTPGALHLADLRDAPDPDAAAQAWMRADLATPFDLADGPLFTHALLRTGRNRWLWYQKAHHAVLDGHGHGLVARRAATVYSALATHQAPGPTPFGPLAALADEEAAYRDSPRRARDRAHWLGGPAGGSGAPTLAGRTAPPSPTSLRSTARLAPATADGLRRLAASVRATWKDAVCAAQAYDLARVTRGEDVVLAVPVMGRTGSVALRTPGMAMNVLPLRLTVAPGTTFAELTHQVVLGIRDLRRHQGLRHEDLRRSVTGPRVNFLPPGTGPAFAGVPSTAHSLAAGPVDDLTVHIQEAPAPLVAYEANPALYDRDGLAAHHARFLALLADLTRGDPHRPLADLPVREDSGLGGCRRRGRSGGRG
ncbi:condensation domain-containing protein [Streptomyces sp. NPDC002537]